MIKLYITNNIPQRFQDYSSPQTVRIFIILLHIILASLIELHPYKKLLSLTFPAKFSLVLHQMLPDVACQWQRCTYSGLYISLLHLCIFYLCHTHTIHAGTEQNTSLTVNTGSLVFLMVSSMKVVISSLTWFRSLAQNSWGMKGHRRREKDIKGNVRIKSLGHY